MEVTPPLLISIPTRHPFKEEVTPPHQGGKKDNLRRQNYITHTGF